MNDHAAITGARQIIQHCLSLSPRQALVIFLDETTLPVAQTLIEAAASLDVEVTSFFIPLALQRRIPAAAGLTPSVTLALEEARAIITCVSAAPDCLPFRDHVLLTERGARVRIGHMPGPTLDVLKMANVDMHQLKADCTRLEQAMIRGSQLELLSYDSRQGEHRLAASIGGWSRPPVASDGMIMPGAWGNVPSGETYIAPIEGSAEGSVVINGSIPSMVVGPGEEIVLHFRSGELVAIEPESSPVAVRLRATQIDVARAKGDPNWSNLAEIGVGVNPAVTQLTGAMLFDEKSAGTIHVALGSNTQMGGQVDSAIHCDMVIRRPTLLIDGKVVVARGQIAVSDDDWLERYSDIALDDSAMRSASIVSRTGIDAEPINGRLHRIVRSETGRVSPCQVGDGDTARLAATIYELLPVNGHPLDLTRLATRMPHPLPNESTRQVLEVLARYGLVQSEAPRKSMK